MLEMTMTWPPSPSVEDEVAALAHEHLIDTTLEQIKSEDHPVGSRGTVDQYPIIVDAEQSGNMDKQEQEPKHHNSNVSPDNHSSDDSAGPATPPPINGEQSNAHLPSQPVKILPSKRDKSRPGSKSRPAISDEGIPRGRPDLSRIQTDVGVDLQDAIMGRRRAPSPYAYKAAHRPDRARRFSGEHLLSPQANGPYGLGVDAARRTASARPPTKEKDIDSSTDSDRKRERRRHSSRRASVRQSVSKPEPPKPEHVLSDFNQRSPGNAQPFTEHLLPSKGLHSLPSKAYAYTSRPHTPKAPEESPYSSMAEETEARFTPGYVPHSDEGESRESPMTSSDESRTKHRHHRRHRHREGGGGHSRRSSMHTRQRPRLDQASNHHSYGGFESFPDKHDSPLHKHEFQHRPRFDGSTYLEPTTAMSGRTPQTIEDVWENAFKENQAKRASCTGRASVNLSPYTSPPQTPPRTPRGDRRSRDFLEMSSAIAPPAQHWSRSPSIEQAHFRDIKPLSAMVGAAGATSAAASIPTLSRSSTTSGELPSSGSISKPSSGQRSRKPSPVYEDQRPGSRSGSYIPYEERPLPRPIVHPPHPERLSSHGGPYLQKPTEPPRLPNRAFSYNSAVEQLPIRPSSHRTASTVLPSAALGETLSPSSQSRFVRSTPSSAEKSPTATLDSSLLLPPPCARSVPRAGYSDWYTVKGIPDIDICPSCMGIVGNSRFRDHFIPSVPKPRNQEVRCSMTSPWVRVAWIQIAKQNRPTLEMLWKLTHLPSVTRPCPGRKFELRPWYRMIDPQTEKPVPNFEVCSACVHAVDNVFPNLKGVLERTDPLLQELGCNLHTDSRRFMGYINEFDRAHTRCKGERYRKSDIQSLAEYARRASRLRECARDGPLQTSAWHFMPELPDFTICEECYDEVVWPIADKPIARNVNRSLKLVPTTRPGHFVHGRTCQLYSERMRKLFLDAVKHNDLEILRVPALKRLDAEQLLQEKQRLLMSDVRAGQDRRAELERNSHIWRSWE